MASTSIFAPIVPAMQSAFVQTDGSADIVFTLSDFNTLANIKGLFVSIIDPNKSAANSLNSMIKKENFDKIYVDKSSIVALSEAGSYKISFDFTDTDLFYLFSNNQFYQVQLYLVDSAASSPEESISWWNVNQNNISIPSQVTLIRFIEAPLWVCDIENQSLYVLPSKATFFLDKEIEPIDSYSFETFYRTPAGETLKYSSNKAFKAQGFKIEIPLKEEYFTRSSSSSNASIIKIYYKTKHGYSGETEAKFYFHTLGTGSNTAVVTMDSSLALVKFNKITGLLQKKDRNGLWENKYEGGTGSSSDTYIDYDIDFRQARQEYRLISGRLETKKNFSFTEFEEIYLSDKTAMMIVSYNPSINDFKYVTQEAITNTLGGKYPVIRRNAHTKYRQFTLTGSIYIDTFTSSGSPHSWTYTVNGETFTHNISNLMSDSASNFYINTEYVAAISSTNKQVAETEAREKVMDFLTNGEPKLFRSFEEGNMIVYLSNISFTPNKTLGRHIYDFSAQATETCEYSTENLAKYNLNNINYTSVISGSVEIPEREPVTMIKSE